VKTNVEPCSGEESSRFICPLNFSQICVQM
jgi:hypothetical protein